MWIFYSLLGAAADTARDIFTKRNTEKYSPYAASFSLHFVTALLCIPYLYIIGIPEIKPGFWLILSIWVIFSTTWPIFMSYALKHDNLSNIAPLLSLNPIISTVLTAIFFHQIPRPLGFVGILCVFAGLYLSRYDMKLLKEKGIFFPFLHIFQSKAGWSMVVVNICWSFGGLLAVRLVQLSSPQFYVPISAFSSATVAFFIVLILDRSFLKNFFKVIHHTVPLSISQFVSEFCVGMALATGFLPYVASIKRSAIIGSTFAGAVFFNEKLTFLKVCGVFVTFLGVILIILGR